MPLTIDDLREHARELCPPSKLALLNREIKTLEPVPNAETSFLNRFITSLEEERVSVFLGGDIAPKDEKSKNDKGKSVKVDSENPFGAKAWNKSRQAALYQKDPAIAERLAKAAGVTLGSTKPNPAYNDA